MTQNISDQQRIAALSATLASLTFALETVANLANLPAQSTEELYKYVSYGKAVIEKHGEANVDRALAAAKHGRITPSEHEKNEWARMANYAYANERNDIGHKFSMAATLCKGEDCSVAWFDGLQNTYRKWLVDGLSAV